MSDRMSVSRILAPTDFSECATRAVEYAKVLAKRFGAAITLLHAAPPHATFEPLPLTGMSFLEPFADEEARAATVLAVYRADLLADVPESDGIMVTGNPAEAIVASSRAAGADIIVMGTHGREGLRRAFLGSVAESVIQQSDRPVLTVRPVDDRPRPAGIARILCPVNYSTVASRAFQHALFLASAFDAELTVLYLEEEGVVDHSAEMKRLREWVGDVPLTMRASLLVDHGEAAAQVNDYALRHGIDLIVMGVQHKRRDTVTVIGTTTATLTRHAPCPVLTVPGDLLVIEEPAARDGSRSPNAMDDIHRLPPVSVISTTSGDADDRLRSATIACGRAGRGAVAFSSHWGAPEIFIETAAGASLELAAHATRLLRTAGLIDGARHALPAQPPGAGNARRQPPLIRVSIPAHFGVDLMLLAGAVLRPLHDEQVTFMGLCGRIDAALRDRFDSSSLEDLKRYANQLPKHRMADLYPLFCLIGAWSGIARGVLDHVFTGKTIAVRPLPAVPRRPRGRGSYRPAGTSMKRSHA